MTQPTSATTNIETSSSLHASFRPHPCSTTVLTLLRFEPIYVQVVAGSSLFEIRERSPDSKPLVTPDLGITVAGFTLGPPPHLLPISTVPSLARAIMLEESRLRALGALNSRYIYGRVVCAGYIRKPFAQFASLTLATDFCPVAAIITHHHIYFRSGHHHAVDSQIQLLLRGKASPYHDDYQRCKQ
jgi:hypothetical protein